MINLKDASPSTPYIEIIESGIESDFIEAIKIAYLKTISGDSKLPDWILKLNGMSGKKYRIFINNLVEIIKNARYLEIGSWKGSTACSAFYNNEVSAICIDNWSYNTPECKIFEEFNNNISKVINKDKFQLISEDFYNVDFSLIGKYNIYFYDGPHEENDQYDALNLVLPALDDEFVFIVDDYNDPRPRMGTERAIEMLNLDVIYSIQIRTSNGVDNVYPTCVLENSDWHNGYFISVIRRK
jgi:hypothetical protein